MLLDTHGFYAPLDALIERVVEKAFAGERVKASYRRVAAPDDAVAFLSERLARKPAT